MKKTHSFRYLLTIFIALFSFAFMFSSSAYAAKTVRGKIKTSSSANANGASVTVNCNGNVLNDTTDSNGDFEVVFPDSDCANGDTVTVNASFNGETGGSTATVGNGPQVNFGTIFLAAVAVPEFGAITGALAALTSGGAFLALKKKFS